MDLYILDSLLRRTEVVDDFESLVWTDRYSSFGDFELDIKSNQGNRARFAPGTLLANNNTDRVMEIETVEDVQSTTGQEMLKIKGISIEGSILQNRIAVYSWTRDPDAGYEWRIGDAPKVILDTIFDHVVRDGAVSIKDKVPLLVAGSKYFNSNPWPETPVYWVSTPVELYTALKSICDPYEIGFAFTRGYDLGYLKFEFYVGTDLTTRQTDNPPIIFSPMLDNIQDTSELVTISGSKNVAYVISATEPVVEVYAEGVDPLSEGFERRAIIVDLTATDMAFDPNANTKMVEAGEQALNNAKAQYIFDGSVDQYTSYKYGVDYKLGDIVELRNKDGIVTYRRVTEVVLASDEQGDRTYPTLASSAFLGANTWADWNRNDTDWSDLDADTTSVWSNQ